MRTIGQCALLAALLSCCLAGAGNEQDRESLRDLDGVRVSVEELNLAFPLKNISSDTLRKTVNAKLEKAGIRVRNQGEFPVGDPSLRIRLATTAQRGLAGYNVAVDFVQIVFMRRNPAVTFNRAQTWKAIGQMGIVPTSQLEPAILKELSAQVDQFISAYRTVNPRE